MNITTLIVIISLASISLSLSTLFYLFLKIKKIDENYKLFQDISKELIINKKIETDLNEMTAENVIKTKKSNVEKGDLNSTQIEIIKLAYKSEITTRDVIQQFNITREHASRLLSALANQGYLKRVNNSKPYKYIIDEKGKMYLSE
ncbi:MAG: hypothetical protein ACP5LF_00415 [Nitrososphaeria archaeon]